MKVRNSNINRNVMDSECFKKCRDQLVHFKHSVAHSDYNKFKNIIRFICGPAFNELKLIDYSFCEENFETYDDVSCIPDSLEYTSISLYSCLLGIGYFGGYLGILDYLSELSDEKDKRFREVFFDAININIEMLNDGIYIKNKDSNFIPSIYLVNLYIMLLAYHFNKDNFENFKAIVDDVKDVIIIGNRFKKDCSFYNVMGFCNKIISIKDYYCLDSLRKIFVDNIESFFEIDDENLSKFSDLNIKILKVYKDADKLKNEGYDINDEKVLSVISDIISYAFESNQNESSKYYKKELLIGERYSYINEKLKEFESKGSIRNDMWHYLSCFDYSIFDYYNKTLKLDKDSFITCMDIIFDSDTYIEFVNKVWWLQTAASIYKEDSQEALKYFLDNLINRSNKESFHGEEVCYPEDCNIRIKKPKEIFGRMMELYPTYQHRKNTHEDLQCAHDLADSMANFYIILEKKKNDSIDENNTNIGIEDRDKASKKFKRLNTFSIFKK